METRTTGRWQKGLASVIALLFAAALSLGMLGGCSSNDDGNWAGGKSGPEASVVKTVVKTASNDLVLADMGDKAHDGVLTISSEDPAYADFIKGLEDHTGFDIQDIAIKVKVTSSTGAVLGAGGGTASQPIYTIESLEANVDSQDVSYTEKEGFK